MQYFSSNPDAVISNTVHEEHLDQTPQTDIILIRKNIKDSIAFNISLILSFELC